MDRRVRQIAVALHARLDEVATDIQRCLEHEIPELGQDALTRELLADSIGANVDTLLHGVRHGIDAPRVQAPTAALEHARRLAQRGVPVHALIRAYRIGQRRMNELVFAEVRATETWRHWSG